jgi:hypothetical protein
MTAPSSSVTGRWRKWFSSIVESASIAPLEAATVCGFGVMTVLTSSSWLTCFATTRRTMSVSDTMPASPPSSSQMRAASPRLEASIWHTVRMESEE